MSTIVSAEIAERLHLIDQQMLKVTNELEMEDLNWRPSVTTPSMAFHLWHSARWSDRVRAVLNGMSSELVEPNGNQDEIWTREGYVDRWGFDRARLGRSETGLGMSDDDAAGLAFPNKVLLLDYAERTFASLERAASLADDALLSAAGPDANGRDSTVGAALLSHLTHVSRHLGMIEALRGVRGGRGTASA